MNPIKPKEIHEIHTVVSISEEIFLSMAVLHIWPCQKETFEDVSVYVELR